MPLHDWTERAGWEGVHIFWMTEIARWLKAHLPAGYRAFIGSSPFVAVDVCMKPDVSVQSLPKTNSDDGSNNGIVVDDMQPDQEVTVATLHEEKNILIESEGRLIAAVALISPRNKDRPAARTHYGTRYLSYLTNGVHLLLVDVHRRPLGFSFAQLIAESLEIAPPDFTAPLAVSYRVGEPAAEGGRLLGIWQRQLTAGEELPSLPMALAGQQLLSVELESTYHRAATDAYLE